MLTTAGTVVFVFLGIIGSVIEHKFRSDIFGSALVLFVVSVTLNALNDIGTRLTRIEEGQHRLARDVQRAKEQAMKTVK